MCVDDIRQQMARCPSPLVFTVSTNRVYAQISQPIVSIRLLVRNKHLNQWHLPFSSIFTNRIHPYQTSRPIEFVLTHLSANSVHRYKRLNQSHSSLSHVSANPVHRYRISTNPVHPHQASPPMACTLTQADLVDDSGPRPVGRGCVRQRDDPGVVDGVPESVGGILIGCRCIRDAF